ncbi:MAG: dicarboxylate/amino acid:cation symporter [Myxococcota bacterium]
MTPQTLILVGAAAGVITGIAGEPTLLGAADTVTTLFIRLLRLVSLPLIFFSLLSTLTGMGSLRTVKRLGGLVLRYTLLTTVIAACIALGLFLTIAPSQPASDFIGLASSAPRSVAIPPEPLGASPRSGGYWGYVMEIVPGDFVTPFLKGNVMSVLLLATLLSLAVLGLPRERRKRLHTLFDDLFSAVMGLTAIILKLLPLAVWAFVADFYTQLGHRTLGSLALYLLCVVAANILQAGVVLPLLLLRKGFSPLRAFRCMLPALTVAFFAKSSSAALPAAIQSAETRLGLPKSVTRFSFPLCTTINMNACAAFILITVLFVSMHHGVTYSSWELVGWVFIATLAAVGNAGVPMGCYLLASAILASLHIPLHLMGVILPFYALIDMLESAINVWSDACVSCAVAADLQKQDENTDDTSESTP